MDNNQYYFEAYFEFIKFADEKTKALEKKHKKFLVCAKKCCGCCEDTTVLPIEFFSILYALKQKGIKPEQTKDKCAFLKNGLCQIYEFRPLICRTHGLPLAYGKDDDPMDKTVSFCELNFKDGEPEFSEKNVLDMDELNIEFTLLNEKFIKTFDDELPERMELTGLFKILRP
jgi:uncharacterized protein